MTDLDLIKSKIDVVEFVGQYLPLKKAGRNYKGLCPFHSEKTPSFMVSPDRQMYHCFGCSKGGNAFGFLMEYERLEFPEAVQMLARKTGVQLPKDSREDAQVASLSTQLYKINELAAHFYQTALQSPDGAKSTQYLLKRGLKEETVQLFKIGYAADKWDGLLTHLRGEGISISLLEKAGLVIAKDGGGYYDRFRNRIVFPIFDSRARPLGFGARVMDSTLPKYVNSPETPIYTKGKNLYGLHLSKEGIRESDYAVIVEGYLDCIVPYQEGLRNIVASQGTALTPEQARLLKRYTHNVVMVYDGDDAGELAALRSLEIFIEEGMSVKVVSLPQGNDPDSFVRQHGIEAFKEKIESAPSFFEYKLNVLKARYGTKEVEAKARVAQEMLSTINKFKNALVQSEYLKKLSEELRVEEDSLLQELKKIKEPKSFVDAPLSNVSRAAAINPTEKLLVQLMLEESALIEQVRQALEPADFQDARTSRVVSILFDLLAQGKSVEPRKLVNYIGIEESSQLICESALAPDINEEEKEKVLFDCIQRLKSQRVKLKRQHLHEQIKAAQHSGDEETMQRLMQEFHELTRTQK